MSKTREIRQLNGAQHWQCATCKAWKRRDGFYTAKGVPHSWCKPCYDDWRMSRRVAKAGNAPARLPRGRSGEAAVRPVSPSAGRVQAAFLGLPAANASAFAGVPLLQGGMPA